jgi:MFS family permease
MAGILVDHLSVPWIFWTSLAATAFATWATWRYVPESPIRVQARIDWGGGALLSVLLLALLLGVAQGATWGWTSGRVIGLFATSIVFFVAFVRYELHFPEPVVDMHLMATRPMWSTNVAAFAVGFAMFGSYILIPQIVELDHVTGYGFGRSTTAAGLVMLPSALVMLFAGPWAGWMGTKFGSRLPLALGSLSTAIGYGALALEHNALWEIAAGATLMGIGIALALAAMGNLVVQAVRPDQTGVATGINVIMRSIGGAVGAQIAASLLASHTILGGRFPAESAFTESFAMSSIAAVIGLACCALIPLARPVKASQQHDLAAA